MRRESNGEITRLLRLADEVSGELVSLQEQLQGLPQAASDRVAALQGAGEDLTQAAQEVQAPGATTPGEALPTGTRMFARGMELAESLTLSFAPESNRVSARLEVVCRSDEYATEMASQLTKTTALLRELIEREGQKPNPADLSGILASGAFRAEKRRVLGYWPIERAFIDNALGGQ
jgi:hypothetical protein